MTRSSPSLVASSRRRQPPRPHAFALLVASLALGGLAAVAFGDRPMRTLPPTNSADGAGLPGATAGGASAGGERASAADARAAARAEAARAGSGHGGGAGGGRGGAGDGTSQSGGGARGPYDPSQSGGGASRSSGAAGPGAQAISRGAAGLGPGRDVAVQEAIDDLSEDDEDEELPRGVGLRADYWKLVDEEIRRLPSRFPGAPTLSRIDPRIEFPSPSGFGLPFIARNIIVRWRGFLLAPEDGVYTLILGADDGARLVVDGRALIEMDRLQPYAEAMAEVALARGFHAVEVLYFQNEGPAGCVLQWVPPSDLPGVVPQEFLFPAAPTEHAPVIDSAEPPRAKYGQVIELRGQGFPEAGEPFEVLFEGRRMDAHLADDGSIRATLPPGIDRGQIFLQVRDTSSEGFAYEVGDVFGVLAEYRTSEQDIPTLADVPGGAPSFVRIEPGLDFPHRGAFDVPVGVERFAAVYRGRLYVHEGGQRRFLLESDDGSRLTIGPSMVIDHDGLHGMNGREGEVFLHEGFHDVRVDFFQNRGGAALRLSWAAPEAQGYQVVPRGALYPPIGYERFEEVLVHQVDPPEGYEGDRVTILGEGLGHDASALRVTFAGREATVELATPARVEVRVPQGARTGPLIVQAGPVAAESVPFRVLGRGLRARYYRFEEEITRMPDVAGRVPDLERIDATLRFGEGFSFGLPYESARFAATWTGSLDCPQDGEYVFHLWSDDGSRLFIDRQLVVDHDGLHGFTRQEGRVTLPAGQREIRVEFFQNLGHAALDLHWAYPGRGAHRVPGTALFPD